jgi:hypothetical protein
VNGSNKVQPGLARPMPPALRLATPVGQAMEATQSSPKNEHGMKGIRQRVVPLGGADPLTPKTMKQKSLKGLALSTPSPKQSPVCDNMEREASDESDVEAASACRMAKEQEPAVYKSMNRGVFQPPPPPPQQQTSTSGSHIRLPRLPPRPRPSVSHGSMPNAHSWLGQQQNYNPGLYSQPSYPLPPPPSVRPPQQQQQLREPLTSATYVPDGASFGPGVGIVSSTELQVDKMPSQYSARLRGQPPTLSEKHIKGAHMPKPTLLRHISYSDDEGSESESFRRPSVAAESREHQNDNTPRRRPSAISRTAYISSRQRPLTSRRPTTTQEAPGTYVPADNYQKGRTVTRRYKEDDSSYSDHSDNDSEPTYQAHIEDYQSDDNDSHQLKGNLPRKPSPSVQANVCTKRSNDLSSNAPEKPMPANIDLRSDSQAYAAPWAKEPTEASRGPSLKVIQEAEANKAAEGEALAAAARCKTFKKELLTQNQSPAHDKNYQSDPTVTDDNQGHNEVSERLKELHLEQETSDDDEDEERRYHRRMKRRSASVFKRTSYNNFVQNMYPTAAHSPPSPPEAAIIEDHRVSQQMALLLFQKSNPRLSQSVEGDSSHSHSDNDEEWNLIEDQECQPSDSAWRPHAKLTAASVHSHKAALRATSQQAVPAIDRRLLIASHGRQNIEDASERSSRSARARRPKAASQPEMPVEDSEYMMSLLRKNALFHPPKTTGISKDDRTPSPHSSTDGSNSPSVPGPTLSHPSPRAHSKGNLTSATYIPDGNSFGPGVGLPPPVTAVENKTTPAVATALDNSFRGQSSVTNSPATNSVSKSRRRKSTLSASYVDPSDKIGLKLAHDTLAARESRQRKFDDVSKLEKRDAELQNEVDALLREWTTVFGSA